MIETYLSLVLVLVLTAFGTQSSTLCCLSRREGKFDTGISILLSGFRRVPNASHLASPTDEATTSQMSLQSSSQVWSLTKLSAAEFCRWYVGSQEGKRGMVTVEVENAGT
ncbi:hypothetical protein HYPSUDRAFT_769613 [Hypholoma sublateritium FD-334 SS-4]|uniref:Secreted protein n=1 Tax=Hypholoma sublateritium (strain FD-334 SS-4) TaxID=945553 RepID=A0A0D2MBS4_HYPSF|nr:hypothetical protein HYPSUDRAFT_769613 [Hypholoma sublateritium FD-334 SS-4]